MTRQFGACSLELAVWIGKFVSIFSKNHPKPEKCEASGSTTSSSPTPPRAETGFDRSARELVQDDLSSDRAAPVPRHRRPSRALSLPRELFLRDMVSWKCSRGSWRLAKWSGLPPRHLVHRREEGDLRGQQLRFLDAGEPHARDPTERSLPDPDPPEPGPATHQWRTIDAPNGDSRENQPLFPAGVPSLTSPLTSPRLALNAPSSTATPPPPRTGASPSTSSPPRASSTTRASRRFERIPSSAGPRRCPRRAPRATGRTVPGASCRATAPTPSPRPPGRSSTSATASASVPASGARHAASARALPRDQPASR